MHIIEYCRGIMFQLPKTIYILIVGTRKPAYYYYMPYVILTHHVTNSNYIWRKNRQTFISFFSEKD